MEKRFPQASVIVPVGSWVRQRVDPHATLPRVTLVRNDNPGDYDCLPTIVAHSMNFKIHTPRRLFGQRIAGDAHISERVGGNTYRFSNIYVAKNHFGYRKGTGLAAYVLAIEAAHTDGCSFANDSTVSSGAKRIWDILVDAGVAEVYTPLMQEGISLADGEPYYSGDVRVDPQGW